MNREQYETYVKTGMGEPRLSIESMGDNAPRTLAYGYTVDRDSHHVYIMDGELHRVVYGHEDVLIDHVSGFSLDAADMRASKRVYPDTVDFWFAVKMRAIGYDLTFLGNYDWDAKRREANPYYAKTHLDL